MAHDPLCETFLTFPKAEKADECPTCIAFRAVRAADDAETVSGLVVFEADVTGGLAFDDGKDCLRFEIPCNAAGQAALTRLIVDRGFTVHVALYALPKDE